MPKTIKPLPPFSAADIERFWKHVDVRGADECWPWRGRCCSGGYGMATIGDDRQFAAHRVAYYVQNGEDPMPYDVLHSCDNPPCCNGAHLSKGTEGQNSADMVHRHRSASGERNHKAKLTWEQVSVIRAIYEAGGITARALAPKFGVGSSTVVRLVNRKTWK